MSYYYKKFDLLYWLITWCCGVHIIPKEKICQDSSVSIEIGTRLENQNLTSGFLEVFMALKPSTFPFLYLFIFIKVKNIIFIQFHITSETHNPWYGTVIRLLHSIAIMAFITETWFGLSLYLLKVNGIQ